MKQLLETITLQGNETIQSCFESYQLIPNTASGKPFINYNILMQ